MESASCLFCKIVAGDIPSNKVYEDDDFIAFEDIDPQASTHVLVVPKKHIATINDLTSENAELAGKSILVGQKIAKERGLSEDGYRLVYNCNQHGGQTVFHIHLHLLGGRPLTWPPG